MTNLVLADYSLKKEKASNWPKPGYLTVILTFLVTLL